MQFYIDTSVAVALLTNEVGTARAQDLLTALMAQNLRGVCSDWTCAEYRCAIAAKYRAGLIGQADLSTVAAALEHLKPGHFDAAALLPSDVVRAGELAVRIAHQSLRAADALHIALAARLGVTHFVTFDLAQAQAARLALVGVQVVGTLP